MLWFGKKEISWTLTISRMEPVMSNKHYPLLDRVHLFAIQSEGVESLQHAIEGIINMV